jgi:hypothetical protein
MRMKTMEYPNPRPAGSLLAVFVIDVHRQEQPVKLSHGLRPECRFPGIVWEEGLRPVKTYKPGPRIKFFDPTEPFNWLAIKC